MKCDKCDEALKPVDGVMETLVSFTHYPPPPCGLQHDDNCQTQIHACANGHRVNLSIQRTCPACDWRGKLTCFCHPGQKLLAWPS
jgi:hypothetical protein